MKDKTQLKYNFNIRDTEKIPDKIEQIKKRFRKTERKQDIILFICFAVTIIGIIQTFSDFIASVIFILGIVGIIISFGNLLFTIMENHVEYKNIKDNLNNIYQMFNDIQSLSVREDITDLEFSLNVKKECLTITYFDDTEVLCTHHHNISISNVFYYKKEDVLIDGKFDNDDYILNVYLPYSLMEKR